MLCFWEAKSTTGVLVEDASCKRTLAFLNCFCQLGSTVVTEPPFADSILILFENDQAITVLAYESGPVFPEIHGFEDCGVPPRMSVVMLCDASFAHPIRFESLSMMPLPVR
jgi:hypothetical protein